MNPLDPSVLGSFELMKEILQHRFSHWNNHASWRYRAISFLFLFFFLLFFFRLKRKIKRWSHGHHLAWKRALKTKKRLDVPKKNRYGTLKKSYGLRKCQNGVGARRKKFWFAPWRNGPPYWDFWDGFRVRFSKFVIFWGYFSFFIFYFLFYSILFNFILSFLFLF